MPLTVLDNSPLNFLENTRSLFVGVKGYPVHSSLAINSVSLSPAAIDCVSTYTVKYRYGTSDRTYVNVFNGLPIIADANIEGVNEYTSVFNIGDPTQ